MSIKVTINEEQLTIFLNKLNELVYKITNDLKSVIFEKIYLLCKNTLISNTNIDITDIDYDTTTITTTTTTIYNNDNITILFNNILSIYINNYKKSFSIEYKNKEIENYLKFKDIIYLILKLEYLFNHTINYNRNKIIIIDTPINDTSDYHDNDNEDDDYNYKNDLNTSNIKFFLYQLETLFLYYKNTKYENIDFINTIDIVIFLNIRLTSYSLVNNYFLCDYSIRIPCKDDYLNLIIDIPIYDYNYFYKQLSNDTSFLVDIGIQYDLTLSKETLSIIPNNKESRFKRIKALSN